MQRKKYMPPDLVKVALEHGQAILAACVATATGASNNTGGKCRSATNCKRSSSNLSTAWS